jgi:sugar transferase EpsL
MVRYLPDNLIVDVGAPPSYRWLKAGIDRYLALVGLILLGPIMLLIGWLVRRDSRGPAMFSQQRAGLLGKPFTFYKFRTMRTDADPYGDSPESGADPRITALGKRLRETSLDELPQLINVIRGEMAIVGPRPLFVQQIGEWSVRHRHRLLVRPGLTGFSQVSGRASITIEEKLDLDIRYIERMSLGTDVAIILRTVTGLWRSEGLYQVEYSRARRRFKSGARAGGKG